MLTSICGAQVYTMGLTPSENSEVLMLNGNVVASIIEKHTGIKLKTYVAQDYTALVESMRSGRTQFAWLVPFGFVLAEKRAGAKVLLKAVRNGKDFYYSAIFTRKDRNLKSIDDLKGKNIAWVDPASSSGHIVPKASLINKGIDPDKFFKRQVFAGGHDSVVLGVLNGSVDAGATFTNEPDGKTGGWSLLSMSKPEYAEKIKVVYVSEPIPNELFATTEKFYNEHRDVVEKVKNELEKFHLQPEGKKALFELAKIDSMVPSKSSEFDMLRSAAKKLKIDIK